MRNDFASGGFRNGQHEVRTVGRPSRQPPPAKPFFPAKPFRVRGKRDVMHEHDRRRLRQQRCRIAGCEEYVQPVLFRCPWQRELLPRRSRRARNDAQLGAAKRGRHVLMCIEHERVAQRRRIRRPCAEQPRQMTADAGGSAAELAGVNADAHFDCERSIGRRRG